MKASLASTFATFLAVAATGVVAAAPPANPAPPSSGTSRAWKISLFDAQHHAVGTIQLHFTSQRGQSCLASFGKDALLLVIDRIDDVPPQLRIAPTAAAKIEGDTISIDLTSGTCDAYVLLEGKTSQNGGATGDINTLSLGGARNFGTFVATVP